MKAISNINTTSENQVLIIGSCCLDRILRVSKFPEQDAKIRTCESYEVGGGCAANTAHGMALLLSSSSPLLSSVSLLWVPVLWTSTIGDDSIGQKLLTELESNGVRVVLSRVKHGWATTPVTTIIVSEQEGTRTCIFTPSIEMTSTNELKCDWVNNSIMDPERRLIHDNYDEHVLRYMESTCHLHTDGRYTPLSSLIFAAKLARSRGISFSIDPEKDRFSIDQDHLLELSSLLFLNSYQMESYFKRRTVEMEKKIGKMSLPKATVEHNLKSNSFAKIIRQSIRPMEFFLRWFGEMQVFKTVVITKGSFGSLYVRVLSHTSKDSDSIPSQQIIIHERELDLFSVESTINDGFVLHQNIFQVQTCGILRNSKVYDTTGAGDAFIAGYLSFMLTQSHQENSPRLALQFASWVAGQKLKGPGARTSLPTLSQVKEELGSSLCSISKNLDKLVGPFCYFGDESRED